MSIDKFHEEIERIKSRMRLREMGLTYGEIEALLPEDKERLIAVEVQKGRLDEFLTQRDYENVAENLVYTVLTKKIETTEEYARLVKKAEEYLTNLAMKRKLVLVEKSPSNTRFVWRKYWKREDEDEWIQVHEHGFRDEKEQEKHEKILKEKFGPGWRHIAGGKLLNYMLKKPDFRRLLAEGAIVVLSSKTETSILPKYEVEKIIEIKPKIKKKKKVKKK